MKNKLKIYAAAVAMTFGAYACSDSFLDTPAQAALSGDLLATNAAGLDATLIAAYKGLGGWTANWGVGPWGTSFTNLEMNYATDDTHKGSEPGDGDGFQTFELFQWNPSNEIFRNKFAAIYEAISRSNSAINTAAAYVKNFPADKAKADQTVAEATALRAIYHFEGWKIWKKIPYYTEVDKDYQKPNDADIYPTIVKDLESAIAALPAERAQVGRVDKMVATAMLGKVKLFNKDYAGALTAFNTVIASKRFGLVDCFYDNFSAADDNNKESILAAQYTVNEGSGGENANFADRLGLPHGDSKYSCCGFNQPTYDLAYAYRTDANGLPIPIAPGTVLKRIEAGSADLLDPRIDYTMGRTGVPYLDLGPHKDSWIRGQGFQGWYSPKKAAQKGSDAIQSGGWTPTQLNSLNVEIMRYADLLLMAAECEVEVGSLDKAREYVNQIRKRAGNCAQGASAIKVSPSAAEITWAKYKVDEYKTAWTSKDAARSAVRLERRLELATEGHRVFDLQRWGTLSEVIAGYNAREKALVPKSAQSLIPDAKYLVFPLPTAEIQKSNGNLKQNTGW
jgi:starch-binding outer membrane protein, SusD/RagB family